MKSWRRQALFQGRHCFCPTPTLGGGGPVKEAGTHSPPCPQYLPNIKPHAMHQVVKGSPLLAEEVYVTHSLSLELLQSEIEEASSLDSPSHTTTSLFLLAPTTSCVVLRLWEACLPP